MMNFQKAWTTVILMLVLAVAGWALSEKQGVIEKNERWTAEEGPYLISDDILVPWNVRLSIAPGTRIMVGKPLAYSERIPQHDDLDSFLVSIKVRGTLSCVGRRNNRIKISASAAGSDHCSWYGILLDSADGEFTEIAYTDIADACNAIVVRRTGPLVRNSVLEYNSVGIYCTEGADPLILNCISAYNFAAGIRIVGANPTLHNNIIAFNANNGIWCDGISHVRFAFNCVYKNADGDYLGCNPEFGVPVKTNKNGDSVDYAYNLRQSPIFAGSRADSLAVEHDLTLPTDRSRIRDTTLAKVVYDSLPDSTANKRRAGRYRRYELSPYSPCRNAGKKGRIYKDVDETRNDMGIWGGPEFRN